MNRFNFGNVITNGAQILSVGATTASRVLGKADTALNNLSEEEKKDYFKMKADKLRDEIRQYNEGSDSAFHNLTNEEQKRYREYQANKMRNQMNSTSETVDEIMENSTDSFIPNNSEQSEHLRLKIKRDREWIANWVENSFGKRNITSKKALDEIRNYVKGDDENADV